MKKTIFLIVGLLLIIIIIIISWIFSSNKQKNNPSNQIIITPTSIPLPTTNNLPLQITATEPTNNQNSVPINQIITITFNKYIASKDVTFSIQPNVQNVINTANTQLTVNFLEDLSPNTTYTYTISNKEKTINNEYSFTTAGQESLQTNDNTAQTMKIWTRANRPDLFLYNNAPYTSSDFSMTSNLTQAAPFHYYFVVTLSGSNRNQDQADFVQWLIALGLTPDQIQNLDIRYQ